MIALVLRFWTFLQGAMSSQLHNIAIVTALLVWAGVVVSVMIWPHAIRLDMAKDVGVVVMALLGIVGGTHAYKATKGVEAGVRPGE